jgi:hypothetical protein
MPDSLTQRLVRFSGIYEKMAMGAFPKGGTLTCELCGDEKTFTVEQAAHYLKSGWPTCSCCNREMHAMARAT